MISWRLARTLAVMNDSVLARFTEIVGERHLLTGDRIPQDYASDESLTCEPSMPAAVARPTTAEEVAALLTVAADHGVPVTARGQRYSR